MQIRSLKNIIIVHGEKSHAKCEPHREFINRLEKTIGLVHNKAVDGVIVSGGATRKDCPTEAAIGGQYLKERISVPVFLEGHSRTTIENITFTKKMLSGCFCRT